MVEALTLAFQTKTSANTDLVMSLRTAQIHSVALCVHAFRVTLETVYTAKVIQIY